VSERVNGLTDLPSVKTGWRLIDASLVHGAHLPVVSVAMTPG